MIEIKKPLRCTYKEYEIPDTHEGEPINEEQFYALASQGLAEKKIVNKNAIVIRIDNIPFTSVENGTTTTQVAATLVDIDSGNLISGVDVDQITLEESSVRYIMDLSEVDK